MKNKQQKLEQYIDHDVRPNATDIEREELFNLICHSIDDITYTKKAIHMIKTPTQVIVYI
jgi:hypothetical protein